MIAKKEQDGNITDCLNQDKKGKPLADGPWRITFDTNPDECNSQCIMCEQFSIYNRKKLININNRNNRNNRDKRNDKNGKNEKNNTHEYPRRMSFEIINSLVKKQSKFGLKEIIPSTMGEPLLYGDFDKIISLCETTGIKLNLTTNGTFPGKDPYEFGKKVCRVASDVKISWNATNKELSDKIMVGSKYEKKLESLHQFLKARDEIAESEHIKCSVTLQMTFMELNYREILNMIKFASDLKINRLKGHHLWVFYPETKVLDMKRSEDSIKRWNDTIKEARNLLKELKDQHKHVPKLENFSEIALDKSIERQTKIVPEDWECPFLNKEAWINWKGDFSPCCAPDDQRKQLGDFGNINEKSLTEIWQSEQYQNLVRNYKSYAICKTCVMRRPVS